MGIETRPLYGVRPLYADEPEPSWPAGDDPDLYKLELWRLHKVGLIQGLRRVSCWKCGYPVIQSGLFLELEGRDGYHCRVVSWSDTEDQIRQTGRSMEQRLAIERMKQTSP